MAKRTIFLVVDDLDGTECKPGEGETVQFAVDDVQYEIDLSKKNAKALRDTLATYMEAGTRLGRAERAVRHGVAVPRKRRTYNAPTGELTETQRYRAALTTWAATVREPAYEVSPWGAIKDSIRVEYDQWVKDQAAAAQAKSAPAKSASAKSTSAARSTSAKAVVTGAAVPAPRRRTRQSAGTV